MASRHQELAEKLISAFKQQLDQQTLETITDAQFDDLSRLIREALTQELQIAIESMEAVTKELRAELEQTELEL